MIPSVLFLLAFLFSTCYASIHDFCVANLNAAPTPSGYPCKSYVTVKDFVFSGLKPANTSNMLKATISPAHVDQIPGLNGLGVSAARLDLDVGGTTPLHYHSEASELFITLQGHITVGFISSTTKNSTVFMKTLGKGDLMVVPQGLLHFVVNAGPGKAAAIEAFSDENPGIQILDFALFGNDLDSSILGLTTLLDQTQIKKLKAVFGGRR